MNSNNVKITKTRYDIILQKASELAILKGYNNFTRKELAKLLGCAPSLITYHFGSMETLKDELLHYAVQREIIPILIQNISVLNSTQIDIPETLQIKIRNYL